ncbi:hypothetical protein IKQ26_03070 [bacterium]|nr:hypothetical protein [bacterium]
MAENHDNNEIEYMTNNEDISYPQDIDVIFNEDDEDDNVKLIIPDYNDMKDFENNSQDDFISDDDLDFVDSVDSSSHDLDVVFEEGDEEEIDDNPIVEMKTDETEEKEVINFDEEPVPVSSEPVLNLDEALEAPEQEPEADSIRFEEPETLPEEQEEEIANIEPEESSELQDVIVIEHETKNEDIEIISPEPQVEEVIPPEPEITIEEPQNIVLTEEPKEEQPEEVVVVEEEDADALISEPSYEEPVVIEDKKPEEEEVFVETRVETELVDNALNELNNSSDFEIIEEPETNDLPLTLDTSVPEKSEEKPVVIDEEAHNFTISAEPDVVTSEPASDDAIIKSILAENKEEVPEEKSEEEEVLEENVFSVCNIDERRGFYFAKNEQTVALFGYIDDEIFLLKDFQELYDKSLGIRLEERKFYSETYLVRVNSHKFLVEVDETAMRIAMEL